MFEGELTVIKNTVQVEYSECVADWMIREDSEPQKISDREEATVRSSVM